MSMWTHVNGNIRLDEFMSRDIDRIKSILGKMNILEPERSGLPLEDCYGLDDNVTLPEGSEGSIQYYIISNTDKHSLPAHSISLFGDLRDYEMYDVNNELVPWFKSTLEEFIENGFMLRNAVLEIAVEDGNHIVLVGSSEIEVIGKGKSKVNIEVKRLKVE